MANVFSTATLGLRVDVNQFNKNMSGAARTATHALESMRLSADAFNDKWRDLTDGIKDTKRLFSGILISQGFYTLMYGTGKNSIIYRRCFYSSAGFHLT